MYGKSDTLITQTSLNSKRENILYENNVWLLIQS